MQPLVVGLHCTNNYCTKLQYLLHFYCHMSLYDTILSGASVDPTSQVRQFVVLVLLVVGN
jgi:hypothetical protein